ncbi:hypothetical protein GCM10023075_18960 [Streptosporangium album]
MIVLGCAFAPLALAGSWVADEISDTDSYVENMAPLAADPDIRDAVVDCITAKITKPLRRQALSPTENLINTLVRRVVASDDFPAIWNDVNRTVHRRLLPILSGEGDLDRSAQAADLGLDLTPVYDRTRDSVDDLVRQELGGNLPVLRPTIDLFSSADLVRARTVYTWMVRTQWVPPILSLTFLGTGVYLARDRKKALTGAGLGLAASMLALAVALAVVRNVYLPDYVGGAMAVKAATTVFDALTGSLRAGLRLLFVTGLLVAGVAYLTSDWERVLSGHQPAAPAKGPRRSRPAPCDAHPTGSAPRRPGCR